MKSAFNPRFPSIESLRDEAKRKIPGFVFDYLDGGCNENINLHKNTAELRRLELVPQYITDNAAPIMSATLFGHCYDAPFGIAPIGLQGLVWPNAAEILARAAFKHNIPFILSTVTTCSIERAAELTQGRAWFQLYHPAEEEMRDSLIERAQAVEMPVLVILSDTPVFGYRPKEIRNGLALKPRMTLGNMLQIMGRPQWAWKTLLHGQPSFETLKPYMPGRMDMQHLGQFMNRTFDGRLSMERIAQIRNKWKGKLVIKGVVSAPDVEKCIQLGIDGIIVSNHGGRQLDAGSSSIRSMCDLDEQYGSRITLMMDSGIRSGPDVARALAAGARFTFLGRSFMYGVAALGSEGADHTIAMLKTQFLQVMRQLSCESVSDLPSYLLKSAGFRSR